MKRDQLISALWAAFLSFATSLGGMLCLETAFSLGMDIPAMVLLCLFTSLFCGGLFLWKHGFWALLAILGALTAGLWTNGLFQSIKVLSYRISVLYDMAYRWGILIWGTRPPEGSVHMALYAFAILINCTVTGILMRRKPCFAALLAGLSPLCLCLVVTDLVPSTPSLLLLVFSLLLLVVPHTVRRRNRRDGNRLTAIFLIPALLCSGALFWAIPRDSYVAPQFRVELLDLLFGAEDDTTGSDAGAPNITIDLTAIGPKSDGRYAVMEVTGTLSEKLYLRGQSYDVYTGTDWSVSTDSATEKAYWPAGDFSVENAVTVTLKRPQNQLYLTYYCAELLDISYGRHLPGEDMTYTLYRCLPEATPALSVSLVRQDAVIDRCLDLPNETRPWAESYLQALGLLDISSSGQRAQAIADYVQNLASYDTQTAFLPDGQTDFARWFLESGDDGYCVHFATAATVLLRAAGIPARYVTGYALEVTLGTNTVREDNSHAWVEYLDYQRGWVLLDPTPALLTDHPTEPTDSTGPTVPGSEPASGQTEPTTQPTEAPTEAPTTQPTQPTEAEPEVPTRDRTALWNTLFAVALAVLTSLALWAQYVLRRNHRQKQRTQGHPNCQALTMWQQIVRFCHVYRLPLSQDLIALAEKAKFSQHTLTDEELSAFRRELDNLRSHLAQKPWYRRILLKLLLAAE